MNQKVLSVVGIVGVVLLALILIGFSAKNMPSGVSPGSAPSPSPTSEGGPTLSLVDKEAILNPPRENASAAEAQAYHDLLVQSAYRGDAIDIGQHCEVTPFFLQAALNSTIRITNNDTLERTLAFFNQEVVIPMGTSKTVTADFGHGQGFEGYSCDGGDIGVGKTGVIGVVYVGDIQ